VDNSERQRIAEDIAVGSGSSMLSGVDWLAKDTARRLARQRVLEVHAPALLASLAAVEGENYSDLLDQMDEAWGNAPEIGRSEINAFLESRIVHKPTTRLRAELTLLRTVAVAAKNCLETHPMFRSEDPKKQQEKIDAVERLADAYAAWQRPPEGTR